jgi:hypothetical protein
VRRLVALEQTLDKFTKRLAKARSRDLISVGLQGVLDGLARDAISEARKLP